MASALLQSAVLAAVGGFMLWRGRSVEFGAAFLFLAAVPAAAALASPRFAAALHGFNRALAGFAGRLLNAALLGPVFYLVFVPGRIVRAAGKRDPLGRRFPSPRPSCWDEPRRTGNGGSYRRQYL